jgi:hypothetical protein
VYVPSANLLGVTVRYNLWLVIVASTSFFFLQTTALYSFGLRTHAWIAQRVIEDLKDDCAVEIAEEDFEVSEALCDSIVGRSGTFLAGALGPDAFPDLITGQVTTHPGIEGDWQTSDWLIHLYDSAESGDELAFAAGYLVHAAGDVFGHTHVNNYAGDIFLLGDERAVERRHFVLEKYIDYRLPGGEPKPDSFRAPAAFLRDRLIFHPTVARQHGKSTFAAWPAAMYGVWASVSELERALDKVEEEAGRLIGKIVAENIKLQAKVATGEIQLEAADVALKGHELLLEAQQRLLDAAKAGLDEAIKKVEDNQNLFTQSEIRAQAARAAIEAAKTTAATAAEQITSLHKRINDLERDILSTPAKIIVKECNSVVEKVCENWCPGGGWNPICRELCKNVSREVCQEVEHVNEVYQRLVNEVTNAKNQVAEFEGRQAQAAVDIAAQTAVEVAAIDAKLRAEAAKAGLAAAKTVAEAAHKVASERYAVEAKATAEARKTADKIRAELAALREKLIDSKSIEEGVKELVAQSDLLSGYAKNWREGMRRAGSEYINTALTVAKLLVRGEPGVFSAYQKWFACHSAAFTPTPYQIAEIPCEAESAYKSFEEEVEKLIVRNLPEPFAGVYKKVSDIKAKVKSELKGAVENALIEVAKIASPDTTTGDFIELLAKPENATIEKLDEVYLTTADAGGKDLISFTQFSRMVDQDLHLKNGKVDAAQFKALDYAVTLAKLALLDRDGLRSLVSEFGGDDDRLVMTKKTRRYSVLYDMVRSIDGNHQWQPFGLPYPRAQGSADPLDAAKRHYGWGPADASSKGLSIFVDPELRKTVWKAIFPEPMIGAIVNHPRLKAPNYPFPTCAKNPFPRTFNPNGSPSQSDLTCK